LLLGIISHTCIYYIYTCGNNYFENDSGSIVHLNWVVFISDLKNIHFHLFRCPIPLFLKDVIGCHYYTHYINFFTSKLRVKDDRSTYVACMRLFWIKQLVCSMNKKSYTIVCMKLILVKLITCGLPWTLPLFPSTMNVLYKFPYIHWTNELFNSE
jgi:hypothetical protein